MSMIVNKLSQKTYIALEDGNLICCISFTDESLATHDLIKKVFNEVEEFAWLETRRQQDEDLFNAGQKAGRETIRRMEKEGSGRNGRKKGNDGELVG